MLLWWLDGGERLRAAASNAIADPGNDVHVSVASVWEIEIKRAVGRLDAPGDLIRVLADNRLAVLPIMAAHGVLAAELPLHHGDPFDRMLVAQAQDEGLVLVTRDRLLASYDVATMLA